MSRTTNEPARSAGPGLPDVCVSGRWWGGGEVEACAGSWRAQLDARTEAGRICAAALPSSADGVALFAALAAGDAPFAALSGDPSTWPQAASLGHSVVLVLPPALAAHQSTARRQGFEPLVLTAADVSRHRPPRSWWSAPGVIVLSSGSTGAPKVAYRPTAHLLAGLRARNLSLGLRPGDGVVGGVPFSSGQGVVQLLTAMALGGPLGIVQPRDHRDTLAMLARPEFALWRATPHYADVIGRCVLPGPARVPPLCVLSSPVSRAVFDTFAQRFGTPLRQTYSSTETGVVSVDGSPASSVVWGTVGHPVAGVEVRIGASPDEAAPVGHPGRVWVRSPWLMAGYGVPPSMHPIATVDGWWGTADRAKLDADGRLTLAGRIDDCVRTRDGRLVDLAQVGEALASIPGVRHAVALAIDEAPGVSLAAVLECSEAVTFESLRPAIAAQLPRWAWPRHTVMVRELPRLATGKPDRLACLALAARAAATGHGAA